MSKRHPRLAMLRDVLVFACKAVLGVAAGLVLLILLLGVVRCSQVVVG